MKGRNFIERSLLDAFSFLQEAVFSEEYSLKKGFLQAREVRIKVCLVLLLLLAVLFSHDVYFLIGIYASCLLLAAASSIPFVFFLKRTWVFIPLFSLFITLPALFSIFSPGEPIISFPTAGLSITRQGVAAASLFFIRVLTSVSLCALLALTTRHTALLKSLRVFGLPWIFVMTLGMTYRYIYLFIEMLQNTYWAIKSRVGYVCSVRKGQRVVAGSIAGLWQRSYALHNDVYKAMLSRGYTGEPEVMEEVRPGIKDWFWLGMVVLLLGVKLWQNYYLN